MLLHTPTDVLNALEKHKGKLMGKYPGTYRMLHTIAEEMRATGSGRVEPSFQAQVRKLLGLVDCLAKGQPVGKGPREVAAQALAAVNFVRKREKKALLGLKVWDTLSQESGLETGSGPGSSAARAVLEDANDLPALLRGAGDAVLSFGEEHIDAGVSVPLLGAKSDQASRHVECGSMVVPPLATPPHDQWRTALAVALRRGPTVHHWGPAYGKHISSALLAAGMWQDALCRFETPAADVLAALVADRSMWRAAVAAYQASCVSFDEAQEHLQHRRRNSHCASSASSSSSAASPAVVARLEAGEGHQSASLMQQPSAAGTVTTVKEASSREHPLPSRVVRGEELPQTVRLQVGGTSGGRAGGAARVAGSGSRAAARC